MVTRHAASPLLLLHYASAVTVRISSVSLTVTMSSHNEEEELACASIVRSQFYDKYREFHKC